MAIAWNDPKIRRSVHTETSGDGLEALFWHEKTDKNCHLILESEVLKVWGATLIVSCSFLKLKSLDEIITLILLNKLIFEKGDQRVIY